jgi:hypothetical protein
VISAVHLTVLEEGALALFDVAPMTGLVWFRDPMPDGEAEQSVGGGWRHALISTHRLNIPLNLILDTDHLEDDTLLPPFPRPDLLREATPCALLVVSRPPMIIQGEPTLVVAGLALVPEGAFGEGLAVTGTNEALDVTRQWLRNPHGMANNDMHPAIQEAFRRQMEHREAVSNAIARANTLLRSCLSPEQVAELDLLGRFHVRVGNNTYRIGERHSYNVSLLDEDGRPHTDYCVVSREFVPKPDQILAQKLLLETDPDTFFRIANHKKSEPPGVQVTEPAA